MHGREEKDDSVEFLTAGGLVHAATDADAAVDSLDGDGDDDEDNAQALGEKWSMSVVLSSQDADDAIL